MSPLFEQPTSLAGLVASTCWHVHGAVVFKGVSFGNSSRTFDSYKCECSDLNSDGPEITHLAQGLSLFSATPNASGLAVWHGGMVAW